METYKNDYLKEEDEMLWELHEIRHEIHEEWKDKSIEERNRYLNQLYEKRKSFHEKQTIKI